MTIYKLRHSKINTIKNNQSHSDSALGFYQKALLIIKVLQVSLARGGGLVFIFNVFFIRSVEIRQGRPC